MLLGYWHIKGLGEPIRLLHVLLALPLEEITYGKPFIKEASHNAIDWKQHCKEISSSFPNLPYYVDNDGITLCETMCILRHVCERHAPHLLSPSVGASKHDEILQFVWSCINIIRIFHYGYVPQTVQGNSAVLRLVDTSVQEMNNVFRQQLDKLLPLISATEGFIFNSITLVDILLYDFLESIQCTIEDLRDTIPQVHAYMNLFESIPNIKAYLEKRSQMRRNAPFAKINN